MTHDEGSPARARGTQWRSARWKRLTVTAAAGALADSYTFNHTYTGNTDLPYSDLYPSAG